MRQIGYLCTAMAMLVLAGVMFVFVFGKSKDQLAQENQVQGRQYTEVMVKDSQKEEAAMPKRGGVLHRLDLWKDRVEDFLDHRYVAPKDFDLDKNGQVGHANIAISSSDFFGRGPGNSVQRDFLPLAFSDFIYAIIFEELGWSERFRGLLYISLLFRTGYIARRARILSPLSRHGACVDDSCTGTFQYVCGRRAGSCHRTAVAVDKQGRHLKYHQLCLYRCDTEYKPYCQT